MFQEFLYKVEGGTPGKRVPEGFVDNVCVLIFTPQNRVRSILPEFLKIVEGGTPYKRVPEGFFDNFCVIIFTP